MVPAGSCALPTSWTAGDASGVGLTPGAHGAAPVATLLDNPLSHLSEGRPVWVPHPETNERPPRFYMQVVPRGMGIPAGIVTELHAYGSLIRALVFAEPNVSMDPKQ